MRGLLDPSSQSSPGLGRYRPHQLRHTIYNRHRRVIPYVQANILVLRPSLHIHLLSPLKAGIVDKCQQQIIALALSDHPRGHQHVPEPRHSHRPRPKLGTESDELKVSTTGRESASQKLIWTDHGKRFWPSVRFELRSVEFGQDAVAVTISLGPDKVGTDREGHICLLWCAAVSV